MAVIEGWGTCLLIFCLGAGGSGLTAVTNSQMAVTVYAAFLNLVGLTLFIFSAAPASGGHLNPSITMATFFAGLCTLPRAVLYIAAQVTGSIVGGYWLRLGLGESYFPTGTIPGCTINPKLVSRGELFVLEYMFAQALIFTAFGVGLDPRQRKVFGPALSPVLVGFTLAFGTLASCLAKPGYTGLSFNPARCMGLMVAKSEMRYHYIHWLGPLAAAMLNGVFYFFAPPYVRGSGTPLSARAASRIV
jgi:glycerol uptake facilitator-like aquaporin